MATQPEDKVPEGASKQCGYLAVALSGYKKWGAIAAVKLERSKDGSNQRSCIIGIFFGSPKNRAINVPTYPPSYLHQVGSSQSSYTIPTFLGSPQKGKANNVVMVSLPSPRPRRAKLFMHVNKPYRLAVP